MFYNTTKLTPNRSLSRPMFKNGIFLLFLAAEVALVHWLLYPKEAFFGLQSLIIAVPAAVGLAFVLTLPRRAIAVFFVFEAFVFTLLLAWHRHFADPLTLQVLFSQYAEGLKFAAKAFPGLLTLPILLIWLFLLVKLFCLKNYFCRRAVPFHQIRWAAASLILLSIGMSAVSFNQKAFDYVDFRAFSRTFGYPFAWLYEGLTAGQEHQLSQKIIAAAHRPAAPLPPALQGLELPLRIYIIQVESLDYQGFVNPGVMPFLQSLAPQSAVYEIKPRPRRWSSNSEFSVIAKAGNTDDFYYSINKLLPADIYKQIRTLPDKAAALGYHSAFYHGYAGNYYDRAKVTASQGFNESWFRENLPAEYPRGLWGVDDADLFDFVLRRGTEISSPRQLAYVVTVSSHNDYDIGKKHRRPHAHPDKTTELYENSLNYVDDALQKLIANAPQNSLFIIYSDHASEETADLRTLLLIYDKRSPRPDRDVIPFSRLSDIIHALFEAQT